jgi:hypothetical protein
VWSAGWLTACSLETIITTLDAQVGNQLTFSSSSKASAEAGGKERIAQIQVLVTAIEAVRRVPPANFSLDELMGLLAKYTCHVDLDIRTEACGILRGLLKSRPLLRNTIVLQLAKLALSIPLAKIESVLGLISLLQELLTIWIEPSVRLSVPHSVDRAFTSSDKLTSTGTSPRPYSPPRLLHAAASCSSPTLC